MMRTPVRARIAAHGVAVCPLAYLMWQALQDQLGTDPASYIVHELGFWGMVFLWVSLSMTPFRLMLKQPYWLAARRALGLWSFAYICLHLGAFLVAWCGLDLAIIQEEVAERPYVLIGVAAWLLMVPLAMTSTVNLRKRMGKRWIQLHRTVYAVAILALIHLSLVAKLEYVKPLAFGIFLIFLFLIRFKARQAKSNSIKCAPSA